VKKRVLVVDDSPFFLKVLSDLLAEDFAVETADSGEAALVLLKASEAKGSSFDLVITDLEMPGLSGYDVAQFVKGKNRQNKFLPVVMLTEKEITKEEARKYGCATYIAKSNLKKVVSMAKILFAANAGPSSPQQSQL
jgi:two-component system chemotaxis sensor kinase CheA